MILILIALTCGCIKYVLLRRTDIFGPCFFVLLFYNQHFAGVVRRRGILSGFIQIKSQYPDNILQTVHTFKYVIHNPHIKHILVHTTHSKDFTLHTNSEYTNQTPPGSQNILQYTKYTIPTIPYTLPTKHFTVFHASLVTFLPLLGPNRLVSDPALLKKHGSKKSCTC